ncbi:MAG: hypothetical protein L0216_08330 [Planctomycetales bacterium]|nr:hypothetical protein [Planctomycetales bacterium]
MRSGSVLRFGLGPLSVRVESETPSLARRVEPLFLGGPPRPGAREVAYRLRRDGRDRTRWIVEAPRGRPWGSRDPEELGPFVQGLVLEELLWALRRRLVLHAASLVHPRGFGVLLAGRSGAGKSTAALALARAGWRFLGDDVALLDPRRGTLAPVGVALTLKGPVPRALRPLPRGWRTAILRFRTRDRAPRTVRAIRPGRLAGPAVPVGPAGEEFPLRAVALLARGPARVEPLSAGEALARLWRMRIAVREAPLPCGPGDLGRLLAKRVAAAVVTTARPAEILPTVEAWLREAGR